MTETLHPTPESQKQPATPEQAPPAVESGPERAESAKQAERTTESRKEAARNELEATPAAVSNPLEDLKTTEAAAQATPPLKITRELKNLTRDRELTHIQRRETAPQRALSKLIHQPVIRVVSEATGRTVSRPSGLLGGGLVAFLGTTSYLLTAKHFGYGYNYLLFLVLFFGGFIIGLVLELVVHLATASHRRSHD